MGCLIPAECQQREVLSLRRLLSILIAACLIATVLAPAATAAPKTTLPVYEPMMYNADREDPGIPDLSSEPLPDDAASGATTLVFGDSVPIGTVRTFPGRSYNPNTGGSGFGLKNFTLRAVGTVGEIWVANNLAWRAGDTRPSPVVTEEQIGYLLHEFETNMYPIETEFFGAEIKRAGEGALFTEWYGIDYSDSDRVIILVDNIRDANYYDPLYPSYVAGFFSTAVQAYTGRNVITIDCYDWANRVGSNDSPWRPADQSKWRPYLYEGTFSHELQHLLHSDHDGDEETWINEGQSTFAEQLCGYGDINDVDDYLWHPYNSLVAWGDQGGLEILSDYAQVYLFQVYLSQRFGGSEFIRALHLNQNNGIQSVNETLAAFGYSETFAEVERDFQIAVLINSPQPGGGRYQIVGLNKRIDFDYHDPLYKDANGNPVYDEYEYTGPDALAWGPAYNVIENTPKIYKLNVGGLSFLPTPWQVVADPVSGSGNVLWANTGALMDSAAIREVDLTGLTTATLNLDVFYDIEEYWDYAFVQVSTDGGASWHSLANEHTCSDVDPNGHPTVFANVPGFTGTNGDWTTETFDLTPYAGQKVLLSLRYVTDWGTEYTGFFVRNISIPELELTIAGDSLDGFLSLNGVFKNYINYQISFVGMQKGGKGSYKILNLDPMSFTQGDQEELRQFLRDSSLDRVVMIVTHAAPIGTNDPAAFDYAVSFHNGRAH